MQIHKKVMMILGTIASTVLSMSVVHAEFLRKHVCNDPMTYYTRSADVTTLCTKLGERDEGDRKTPQNVIFDLCKVVSFAYTYLLGTGRVFDLAEWSWPGLVC
jgi:hypothetical protein